jgi:hypothetical protein
VEHLALLEKEAVISNILGEGVLKHDRGSKLEL